MARVSKATQPQPADRVVYAAASVLLSYPTETLLRQLDTVEQALHEVRQYDPFADTFEHLRGAPLGELQSWHVQEFDLSRRHALYLTYWTDGDTRRRGEVLASIKRVYRESGLLVDLDGELPDFLPMVLEFAASGSPQLGRSLLVKYRASLELLRLGLERDDLPQASMVAAICLTLGGPSPKTHAEIERLYAQPPTELVGLETGQLAGYPIYTTSSS